MADDHTSQAWGCYGSRLAEYAPTKNIDRLRGEGAMLTNYFCTNSICVPSRASILTGQYGHVNGAKTLNVSNTTMEPISGSGSSADFDSDFDLDCGFEQAGTSVHFLLAEVVVIH